MDFDAPRLPWRPPRLICSAIRRALATAQPAHPPPASGDLQVVWEVKNRFRLFRNEADFLKHAAADPGNGVLAAEQQLAQDTDGRGWAKDVLGNLCVDITGRLQDICQRDGEKEIYLNPTITGWACGSSSAFRRTRTAPGRSTTPCRRSSRPLRHAARRCGCGYATAGTTVAVVDVTRANGTADSASTKSRSRDI